MGKKILIDLLNEKGYDISSQHTDCGIEIFDKETQDTHLSLIHILQADHSIAVNQRDSFRNILELVSFLL